MLDSGTVDEVGRALFACLRDKRTMAPLSAAHPDISVDDAYQISQVFLEQRMASGERVVGKKIGLTSEAVQKMLGVFQPDFGFLTDAMWVRDGVIDTASRPAPKQRSPFGSSRRSRARASRLQMCSRRPKRSWPVSRLSIRGSTTGKSA